MGLSGSVKRKTLPPSSLTPTEITSENLCSRRGARRAPYARSRSLARRESGTNWGRQSAGYPVWDWHVVLVSVVGRGRARRCNCYRGEGGLGADRQAVHVSGQQRAVLVSQPMTSARPPLPTTTARRRARSQSAMLRRGPRPGAGGGLVQQATTGSCPAAGGRRQGRRAARPRGRPGRSDVRGPVGPGAAAFQAGSRRGRGPALAGGVGEQRGEGVATTRL